MEIKVKYFDGQQELKKITVGDWIDLRSNKDFVGYSGGTYLIPLGVAMQLPKGYEAIVAPRSSSFKKYGFIQTNSIGVIDESYCGDNDEWKLPVYFVHSGVISKGDRICQFRIQKKMPKVEFKTVETLGNPDRKGFGSTGSN